MKINSQICPYSNPHRESFIRYNCPEPCTTTYSFHTLLRSFLLDISITSRICLRPLNPYNTSPVGICMYIPIEYKLNYHIFQSSVAKFVPRYYENIMRIPYTLLCTYNNRMHCNKTIHLKYNESFICHKYEYISNVIFYECVSVKQSDWFVWWKSLFQTVSVPIHRILYCEHSLKPIPFLLRPFPF